MNGAIYLAAAERVPPLLRLGVVAERWQRPSALAEMSTAALAGHLASQLVTTADILRDTWSPQAREGEPVRELSAHYAAVRWRDAPLDDATMVAIREGGARLAGPDAAALAGRAERALADLGGLLADRHGGTVHPPWLSWALGLDDFLLTRAMEIVVHSDDLAVSLDVPTPGFPKSVWAPVLGLLAGLAVDRHGLPAVLRTLTRAERAPASIAAF